MMFIPSNMMQHDFIIVDLIVIYIYIYLYIYVNKDPNIL